jgi:hypothetical protein
MSRREPSRREEGRGRLQKHVRTLVGDHAPDEAPRGSAPRRPGPLWPVEPGRVDRVLRQPDDLVRKGARHLACRVAGARQHRGGRTEHRAASRRQLVEPPYLGQPFALAAPLRLEARRPGHAAIEWPQHEGAAGRGAFRGDGRDRGGRQRRDPVHEIEAPRRDVRPEAAPDQALEIGIEQAVDRGGQRPGGLPFPMRSTWVMRQIGRVTASVSMAVNSRALRLEALPAGWHRGCAPA